MPLDFDFDFHSVTGTKRPVSLDPIETVDPEIMRALAFPVQPASDQYLRQVASNQTPIDMEGPAPLTREGQNLQNQRLAVEGELVSPLTPSGQDPRIHWGTAPQQPGNLVTDTLAQGGTGILSGLASMGRTLAPNAGNRAAATAIMTGAEDVSNEIGGLPGVHTLARGVTESAPYMVAGAFGGVPGIVGYAATTGASDGYRDAVEQGYEHPEAVGLAKGLISGLVMAIPGSKGIAAITGAKQLVGEAAFNQLLRTNAKQLGFHAIENGVVGAAQMGVQSLLDSLVDKATTNPNLTLSEMLQQAGESAVTGGIIGGIVSGVHQAAAVHDARTAAASEATSGFLQGQRPDLANLIFQPPTPLRSGEFPVANTPGLHVEGNGSLKGLDTRVRSSEPATPPEDLNDESTVSEVRARNTPTPVSQRATPPENLSDESTVAEVKARNGNLRRVIPLPDPRLAKLNALELFDELTPENQDNLMSHKPLDASDPAVVEYLRRKGPAAAGIPIEQTNKGVETKPVQTTKEFVPPTPKQLPEATPSTLEASAQFNRDAGRRVQPVAEAPVLPGTDLRGAPRRMTQQGALPPGAESVNRTPEVSRGVEGAPRIPTKAEDIARYNELQKQFTTMDFANPQFHDLWDENETIKNRYGGMPPVADEPVKPVAAAPKAAAATPAPKVEPTVEAPSTKLPAKGERVTLGEFFVTRDRLNKVVLRAVDETESRALAKLKSQDPEALNRDVVMRDLLANERGQETKYWEFPKRKSTVTNAAGKVLKTEKAQEAVAGYRWNLDPKKAVDAAIIKSSDSLTGDILTRVLSWKAPGDEKQYGAAIVAKGDKAITARLREIVGQARDLYVKGKLREFGEASAAKAEAKTGEGKGDLPAELLDAKGKQHKPEDVLGRVYNGDEAAMLGRVVDLLVKDAQGRIAHGDQMTVESRGLTGRETSEETKTEAPDTEAMQAKAAQGGGEFSGDVMGEVLSDEMLKGPDGKFDKGRVAMFERASDIKEEINQGVADNYDEAIMMLRKLGYSLEQAELAMDKPGSLTRMGEATPGSKPPAWLVETPTLAEALSLVASNGSSTERSLANLLLSRKVDGPMEWRTDEEGARGRYFPDTNLTRISPIAGDTTVEVVLHEAIHAATVKAIASPSTPEEVKFKAEMDRLFNLVKERAGNDPATAYALTRVEEFVAALTDPAFRETLNSIPDTTKATVWQKIVEAVKQLFGIKSNTALESAFEALYGLDTVSKPEGGESLAAPEIKNKSEYERMVGYQELPAEERELANRKAIANNQWSAAPDVLSVYDTLPPRVKRILNAALGKRHDVLRRVNGELGSDKGSSIQEIVADPSIHPERKSEISNSTLYNFLHFRNQADSVRARANASLEKLQKDMPKLNEALSTSDIQSQVFEQSLGRVIEDFKSKVMEDRAATNDEVRSQYLTRMITLADDFKGDRRAALSKFVSKVADAMDLNTLLSTTDPKALQAEIVRLFPPNSETAQKAGASEETIRLASLVLANSNNLRDELLTIKLSRDPKVIAGVLGIDEQIRKATAAGDLGKELANFTSVAADLTNKKQEAVAVWQRTFKQKARRMEATSNLLKAAGALDAIQQTPSYRNTFQFLVDHNQATQPMKFITADNLIRYVDPITQDVVDISVAFDRQQETANYKKLAKLIDSAKAYVADPDARGYDPLIAGFWKNVIANSDAILDPTISVNARKLIPAKYDVLQSLKLAGALTIVPDAVLREVGGRAANDAQVGFQAYAAVDSQLKTLKERMDSSITLSAKKAADSHKLDIDTWHTEVLNPVLASMQHTGYDPLKPGSKTLWGHTVTREDINAAQVQASFDRQARAIGTEAKGNPAVGRNKAEVRFTGPGGENLTRKAAPTGALTMSRRLNDQANNWATLWASDRSVESRVRFLDDNFVPVVMGHINNVGADNYAVRSELAPAYKQVQKALRDGQHFETTQDVVDYIFEHQEGDAKDQQTKLGILERMFADFDTIFDNVTGFRQAKEKSKVGPVLNVVTSDNSFTQERGKLIAPTTFYEHGLTFDGQRVSLMHSAKAHYAMELIGDGGLLDRLRQGIGAQLTKYEARIDAMMNGNKATRGKATGELEANLKQKQLDGDLLLTYQQARQAEKQVGHLLDELRRGFATTTTTTDPGALQLGQATQGFLAANLMMSPMAESTNLFGGFANLVAFDKMLSGSVLRGSATFGARLMREGLKDILAATAHPVKGVLAGAGLGVATGGPVGAAVGAAAGAGASAVHWAARNGMLGEMGEAIYKMVKERQQLHREMEAVGLAGAANLKGDMQANLQLFSEGGRPQTGDDGLVRKAIQMGESTANLIAKPMSSVFPRVVDRLINEVALSAAGDLEKRLLIRAMKAGDARDAIGALSRLDSLTDQEMAGHAGPGAARDAENIRETFRRIGLNADAMMIDAYNRKKSGEPVGSLFGNEGSKAAFNYSVAQDVNLGSMANRPTSTKGGKIRNLLGLFFGFPIWQATQLSRWSSRLSTEKSTKNHIGKIAALAATLAIMGATATVVKKQLSRNIFNEEPGYQDITDAQNPQQAAAILANGLAQYVPFAGWIINNLVLQTPNKNGFDISSQFAMLNFANDLAKGVQKAVATHDTYRPAMDLLRRWSPISRVVLNSLPANEGLVDYYNISRQLRTIAPEGMENKKPGGGQSSGTPTTPIMQDMINAAYRGDSSGFSEAANRYIKYQVDNGKSLDEAQKSLQSSWQAHHPYVRQFGRLPTSAEEAALFNNATPQQQASILKSNEVFESYGALLGGNTKSLGEGQRGPTSSGAIASIAGANTNPSAGQTSLLSPAGSGLTGGTGPLSTGKKGNIFGTSIIKVPRSKGGGSLRAPRGSTRLPKPRSVVSGSARAPKRIKGSPGGSLRVPKGRVKSTTPRLR